MIAVIRISGEIGLDSDVKETLFRMRLRKKYSCVVFDKITPELNGMLKKVRNFVAYGEIDDATHKELIAKRGKKIEGKLKLFFRLHPPIGGIDSMKHFGVTSKAVLGDNGKEINSLIRRML